MPKNPEYLAPVELILWDTYPIYNRKYKAWDLNVFQVKTGRDTQPLGANGYDADNLYPIPFIYKQTEEKVYIKYHGVGMGDGPFKREYFLTEQAARNAGRRWLGNRKEMTAEQMAEVVADAKAKELADARKTLKHTQEILAKLENGA